MNETPWSADMPQVCAAFNLLHIVTAWLFTALVAGHLLMAARHALMERDSIFTRISPWAPSP